MSQGSNQVCSQRWARIENSPIIKAYLQWRKRNIFQRGQNHISWFFTGVKCFFPGTNFHFGTPKTKRSLLIFIPIPFPFEVFLLPVYNFPSFPLHFPFTLPLFILSSSFSLSPPFFFPPPSFQNFPQILPTSPTPSYATAMHVAITDVVKIMLKSMCRGCALPKYCTIELTQLLR